MTTCRSLLSEINRDPATSTYGCLDRRFWAWKIADFPEATFQRNLLPLAWYANQHKKKKEKNSIRKVVASGLLYTFQIQHRDGSYDQAYPNERSYGATAFLLADLIQAYKNVRQSLETDDDEKILAGLQKSADFLYKRNEEHGVISNHLAGSALGLLLAGQLFGNQRYSDKAKEIVQSIVKSQSPEGWYPEYGGADPGYQTLCMYYLANIYQIFPESSLHDSLTKSLDFLKYFIHPDGSFGGEYGSRRTEIYYPGGIALLASESDTAITMNRLMLDSIESGNTVTLMDVDMGNTAPLLNNYIQVLEMQIQGQQSRTEKLPFQKDNDIKVFDTAGIAAISQKRYYCILGGSCGGVAKIFNKASSQIVMDDSGILGKTSTGKTISTQVNLPQNELSLGNQTALIKSKFFIIDTPDPAPLKFLILRLLNLTLMNIKPVNEWIKKMLVGTLIKKQKPVRMERKRTIKFFPDQIQIDDEIIKHGKLILKNLRMGVKFSAIHMASARYFHPGNLKAIDESEIDVDQFNKKNRVEIQQTIKFTGNGVKIER